MPNASTCRAIICCPTAAMARPVRAAAAPCGRSASTAVRPIIASDIRRDRHEPHHHCERIAHRACRALVHSARRLRIQPARVCVGTAPALSCALRQRPARGRVRRHESWPMGMVQTGVPFGDVKMVRDWLEIEGAVGHPPHEHPKRPVQGFACKRHEPSGTLLWGWARDRYETPERFFKRYFVVNYCPLAFFDEAGSNLTPDKLRAAAKPLLTLCDEALARSVVVLWPRFVIGVGGFAAKRAEIALKGSGVTISSVLHPSPANPKARHDWKGQITKKLQALGIE